jgi:glycosyltransferase involved in cell wall biosynthesis
MNMQEIKKKKIIVASLLKPVDDTRMFEKLGLSLAAWGHEVHIIGYPTQSTPTHSSIHFHALHPFKRISVNRLAAALQAFRWWCRLKPDILIVSTHELLIYATLTRIFLSTRIIYDIRENYYYNILHTNTFPWLLRLPLATYVRVKEKVTAPWISQFLLAEKGYRQELAFLPNRCTVLENKFRQSLISKTNASRGYSKLLFTGTLAATTGVFKAIDLAAQLHALDNSITLSIIGYAAKQEVLDKLYAVVTGSNFITLTGGSSLVPHPIIIEAISEADYGILWYPANKSTRASIPTKFYEYAALGLRMLSPDNSVAAQHITENNVGLLIEPNDTPTTILAKLKSFSITRVVPAAFYWENQEASLKKILEYI